MITLFSCHNICALNNTCVYAHTWLCQHIEALKLCSRLHIAQLMRSNSAAVFNRAMPLISVVMHALREGFPFFHPTLQATQHLLISTPHCRQLNICFFPPHTAGNSTFAYFHPTLQATQTFAYFHPTLQATQHKLVSTPHCRQLKHLLISTPHCRQLNICLFPPHTAGNSTFAYFHPTPQATQHLLISTPHCRQLILFTQHEVHH